MNEEQNITGFIEELLNLHRTHLISHTHTNTEACVRRFPRDVTALSSKANK